MLCIAHRGYSAPDRPENSLAAVQAALALGVDGIEVDLWFLHGRFWMHHDRRLITAQGQSLRVQDLSAAELAAIELANGEPLSDLPELLRLVGERCLLNLELKNAGGTEALARALDDFSREQNAAAEHIIVSSFHHPTLYRCRQRLPEIKIGALLAALPAHYADGLETLEPYSVNSHVGLTEPELVEDIHRRGYRSWVYTANDRDDWRALDAMQVDAVFTDRPRAFMGYRESGA